MDAGQFVACGLIVVLSGVMLVLFGVLCYETYRFWWGS